MPYPGNGILDHQIAPVSVGCLVQNFCTKDKGWIFLVLTHLSHWMQTLPDWRQRLNGLVELCLIEIICKIRKSLPQFPTVRFNCLDMNKSISKIPSIMSFAPCFHCAVCRSFFGGLPAGQLKAQEICPELAPFGPTCTNHLVLL